MACGSNRVRLLCMLSLSSVYFIVEVVVSQVTGSLAMLMDSFHTLTDVIAMAAALVAVKFAEKTHATNKNSFGWIRAEVVGALVNAVFLTALCFTIVLEAIGRFADPREIESPQMLAGAGTAGFLFNLVGLCLFHGHGHGHSHGNKNKRGESQKAGNGSSGEETNNHHSPGVVRRRNAAEVSCDDGTEVQMNDNTHLEEMDNDHDSSSQLNMRGVFLHVLADALGSVIVVVNSLIFIFVWQPCNANEMCVNPCIKGLTTNPCHLNHTLVDQQEGPTMASMKSAGPCWALYLDPTLCLISVGILLYMTYPLLKESALILLQTVPKQINMHQLNERLLSLDGILSIHELHIWRLAGSRFIATAHIKCHDLTSYMDMAKRIKDFFHSEGIHATTIQLEFFTFGGSESRDSRCELSCQTRCAPMLCCGSGDKHNGGSDKKASTDCKSAGTSALEVISETPEEAAAVEVFESVLL